MILSSSSLCAQELEKISIKLDWLFQFEHAGFIAAKEKGFYKEAGLEVELLEYASGEDTIDEVLNLKADFGVHNSNVIVKDGELMPIVLLATYLHRSPLVFVTNKSISKPSEMLGKKIMGTSTELKYSSLALLLNHYLINSNNSKFIEHTFNSADFINGKIDVMTAFRTNQLYELEKNNIAYNIIDPADYGFLMGAVNLYSSVEQVTTHPERTHRLLEATNKGWQYAINNVDEIIQIIYQHYSQRKTIEALKYEAVQTLNMMLLDQLPIGSINKASAERSLSQLKNADLIDDNLLDKIITFEDVAKHDHLKGDWILSDAEIEYLSHKQQLNICVDPDQMPMEGLINGQYKGIVADIFAKAITPNLPIAINFYQASSWKDAYTAAVGRRCDLIAMITDTEERQKYFDFSQPYLQIPFVMATSHEEPFIDDLSVLGNKKIAIVSGYSIAEQVHKDYPELQIVPVDSLTEGMLKLAKGEVYGYLDLLPSVARTIQHSFAGQIKISSRLEENVQLSFATRNDEPLLHKIFERAANYINQHTDLKQQTMNDWISVRSESMTDYTLLWKIIAGVFVFSLIAAFQYNQLRKHNKELREISITDPLTKVFNRIVGNEEILLAEENFKRYGDNCGLIMVDIDYFKRINDTFGHGMGDKVLVHFANILKTQSRKGDRICRWGGEEFLIICTHSDIHSTKQFAKRLIENIRNSQAPHGEPLTASLGVGALTHGLDAQESLEQVDQALYKAKASGRNQIITVEGVYSHVFTSDGNQFNNS